LNRLADLLNGAKKVALFCGIGCAGARGEVVALAGKLQAPVGYSFRGKEWVEYDNPTAVGMSGLLGWGAAYQAMHECDVLLLLSTDFPYESFMPTTPKIARIDIRAERLGRRSKLDLDLCGDVGDTLRALLPRVDAKVDRAFLGAMLEYRQSARRKLRAYVDRVSQRRPIHPEHVAATLDELAGAAAVFTIDTGMCAVRGARRASWRQSRPVPRSRSSPPSPPPSPWLPLLLHAINLYMHLCRLRPWPPRGTTLDAVPWAVRLTPGRSRRPQSVPSP
jgi:pyruvate dehydrogenase (quinone)